MRTYSSRARGARPNKAYTARHRRGGVMRLLVAGIAGLVITTTAVASTRYQVDLATGNLDGKRVLGRSLADVRTTLGRPDLIAGPRNRRLVAWGGGAGTFRLAVLFRPTGNRLLARTLVLRAARFETQRSVISSAAPRGRYRSPSSPTTVACSSSSALIAVERWGCVQESSLHEAVAFTSRSVGLPRAERSSRSGRHGLR